MIYGGEKMKITKIILVMLLLIVISPITVSAQNTPIIRLNIANYEPMPVQPGQFVDVSILVQNIGAGDARDIEITFIDSPFFELVSTQDKIKEIPVLGSYNDFLINYRLKVSDNVVEGQNQITFEYTLRNQPGIVSTANLNLDVKSTEVPISISSVRLTQDEVEPGERTDLIIAVTNPSQSSNIRDVSLTLQLASMQGNQLIELPFAPVDSTNKKSINRIQPGQTTEFRFNLITYPDAESKIYKVPVLFTYFDDTGRLYEQTSFVSIMVNSKPDIYAIIESTTINQRTRTGDIVFDIINKGVTDIKLLTVKINENENFEILSTSNVEYLGKIESDDFKSSRYRIKVSEDIEDVTFPITLTYKDALNNEFEETIQITHKLRQQESNGNGQGTLIIIVLALGIVGFLYFRRRQRRKKVMREDD
jgi:hypothetical protein